MANNRQTSWTDERKRKFLRNLARIGNVTLSARLLGSSRARAYEMRAEDPHFAKLWKDALREAADNLEAEAHRRAVTGVDEPVFYKGEVCGHIRRYSDTLLHVLLKHTKPRKYTERRETTHKGTLEVKTSAKDLSDDQLAAIAARGLADKKG
jgi:hypothetical protein